MEIIIHQKNDVRIAEVSAEGILIANAEDGLDLLGNLYYQDIDRIIVHEQNISPDFFDLKTGIAGEILQKFSNYRVRLAIVGGFSAYQSNSFKDLMFESNKFRHVNFVATLTHAVSKLSA